jgi:hypothetical protein
MNPNATTICVLGALGVVALIYVASQQTGSKLVPQTQSEAQAMGLNVAPNMRVAAGTPLDLSPSIHFWHPGYDPDMSAQPTMQPRHRYPALPGGNISNVMHMGWSSFWTNAPADNDWRLNPPEAAVL